MKRWRAEEIIVNEVKKAKGKRDTGECSRLYVPALSEHREEKH